MLIEPMICVAAFRLFFVCVLARTRLRICVSSDYLSN
jgi:hypothetical protein